MVSSPYVQHNPNQHRQQSLTKTDIEVNLNSLNDKGKKHFQRISSSFVNNIETKATESQTAQSVYGMK